MKMKIKVKSIVNDFDIYTWLIVYAILNLAYSKEYIV